MQGKRQGGVVQYQPDCCTENKISLMITRDYFMMEEIMK